MSVNPSQVGDPVLRTVIIDDTTDLRELLRLALDVVGYDVVGEAGDGRTGIEVVRAQCPDVVLLDVAMPVMDGLEALPSIREACPTATIVMLSAFTAEHVAARALASGAAGFVPKGVPLAVVLDRLRALTRS